MSLYESEESNGSVSLLNLFNHPENFDGCESNMTIDDIIFAICRGGWPKGVNNSTPRSKLEIAKDLYAQTYSDDISNIDNTRRNPELAQMILRSYSRNICTLAEKKVIFGDVKANFDVSQPTFDSYLEALQKTLYNRRHRRMVPCNTFKNGYSLFEKT